MNELAVMSRLIEAGIEEKAAKAIALEMSNRDTQVATKDDINEVKRDVFEVKQEIADVKTELKADIRQLRGWLMFPVGAALLIWIVERFILQG